MKILYITNPIDIAVASGGFISDYLNDLAFYGLTELFGDDVVSSSPIFSLYQQYQSLIHPKHLWGGFTCFHLLDKDNTDRTNLKEKILSRFFDVVIYGSIRRCHDYYNEVKKAYPDNKVICLDGNDDNYVLPTKHIYFKRELLNDEAFPISFAFPTCKLAQPNRNKNQAYGICVPGNPSTYIFHNEMEYYDDYQKSYYGITMKKAGWDCMRHYEILGNYCVPFFKELDKCPTSILHNFPKQQVLSLMGLIPKVSKETYYEQLDELFDYTKQHLTTLALAKYIISRV